MSDKAKCPRCGADVRIYDTGVEFSTEAEQDLYERTIIRVQGIEEAIRSRIADGEDRDEVTWEMEDELREAKQERSLLARRASKRGLFVCDSCGFERSPSEDRANPGVYVIVDETGFQTVSAIYYHEDTVSRVNEIVRYCTDSAYREAQDGPGIEPWKPLYYRVQVWDEETKTVKVVAEGGDPKLCEMYPA